MNPFRNARIIDEQVDPAVYLASVGEHDGRPAQRGDAEFVMSRSSLMEVWLCAERWRNGFERKESDATEYGSRFDTLALDSERWGKKYTVHPDTYPCDPSKADPRTEKPWNGNSNWCKLWTVSAEKAGREVISEKEDSEVKDAVTCLHNQPEISALIQSSKKQVFITGEYHDEKTGLVIPVRTLIDLVPDGRVGDLKSSASADPLRWAKSVFDYNYDAQGAMNLDLFNAATGEERVDFFHIIQENFAPWQVCFPMPILSAELIKIGRFKVLAALEHYALCLKSGNWPGYGQTQSRLNSKLWPFQLIEPNAHMEARAAERIFQPIKPPTEAPFVSEIPS